MLMLQYENKEFKTATGETIRHFKDIERLLMAMHFPKMLHFTKGNQLADANREKRHVRNPFHYRRQWSGQVLLNRKNHSILRKN